MKDSVLGTNKEEQTMGRVAVDEIYDQSQNKKKSKSKKRREPHPDTVENNDNSEALVEEPQAEYDMSEPTMGEKLESLSLIEEAKTNISSKQGPPSDLKPPSADSVHVLLKQALHAEDQALLLNCLYTRDEKVIANSTSLLNPSDVLKLLKSLISMMQSRGAVLVCAIPWLRSLLLQHSSSIMSQESSLRALNSLYQLIEVRVSTFSSALQLSSSLDYLLAGVTGDEGDDEGDEILPVIYEDKDDSEEEEEGDNDTMETDQETDEERGQGVVFDSPHESDASDVMSD